MIHEILTISAALIILSVAALAIVARLGRTADLRYLKQQRNAVAKEFQAANTSLHRKSLLKQLEALDEHIEHYENL